MRVRFGGGSCELGDAVSSPRCPCLQKLSVISARGLANLVIHSESLLRLDLQDLDGLQHLTIVAQALEELRVDSCFDIFGRPVVNISTPHLFLLDWLDFCDPTSVQLGNFPQQLQHVSGSLCVYTLYYYVFNRGFLQLLERFQAIQILHIMLLHFKNIGNFQNTMEDLTKLPGLTTLTISLKCNGHNFGASLFHLLRICSDLRMLLLLLHDGSEVSYLCPSGCVCDQPTWKTKELTLNCLEKVSIVMEGTDHQVDFVKRLFTWAVVLKTIKIKFVSSISECKEVQPDALPACTMR